MLVVSYSGIKLVVEVLINKVVVVEVLVDEDVVVGVLVNKVVVVEVLVDEDVVVEVLDVKVNVEDVVEVGGLTSWLWLVKMDQVTVAMMVTSSRVIKMPPIIICFISLAV